MSSALVLQHGDWGPPGILGEWALERGIDLEVVRVDLEEALPDPEGYTFIASLGSKYSPADADVRDVALELALLGRAVASDTPVLGLCYGGQALAHVLGGRIEPAPVPELGWHAVESDDPTRIPSGPWLQWHYHRFTTPPGAEELARSPAGSQAFAQGRHLGVQFHPESTIDIVQGWAALDAERIVELGITDGEAHVASGRAHAGPARDAAYRLFDAFRHRLRT